MGMSGYNAKVGCIAGRKTENARRKTLGIMDERGNTLLNVRVKADLNGRIGNIQTGVS